MLNGNVLDQFRANIYVARMRKQFDFRLRPAQPDDFSFAEELYLSSMKPLMEALGCWNEAQRKAAFRRNYVAADTEIIFRVEKPVEEAIGWLHISERDTDYNLSQIQILPEFCDHGIGSIIIGDLLKRARNTGKTVSLSAVRNNRAIGLYERFGFRKVDADASPILEMVWNPDH